MNSSPKYNPGLLSDEELVKAFVVRKHDLDLLIQIVDQNTSSESNQHILVVGQRGIGKTTLVRRAAAEIRSSSALNNSWFPIVFAEETYSATNPAELWLEALLRLHNQTNEGEWRESYERIRSERDQVRACDAALGALLDFADRRQTRLVLILENFAMLIQQFETNASWELRHTLSNEKRLMLLATAPSKFSDVDDLDAAWFEFFVVHELKPLSLRECRSLWRSLTGKILPGSQARAIEILTGGNPRLIRILTDFAVRKSFRQLVDELTCLIDEHTEYFKNQIDSLPTAERKVLVALLDRWNPGEARELAAAARMEVSKTSALLTRLMDRGLVAIKLTQRKKRLYQVSERLFNIYYLMRRQGHPADRVRAAVRFMVVLYRDNQLVDTVTRLAGEACELDPKLRRDHFLAYEELIQCELDPAVRSAIIDATPSSFAVQMPPRLVELIAAFKKRTSGSGSEDVIQRALDAIERKDLAGAESILREAVGHESQDGHVWAHLGDVLAQEKKLDEAVDALRKATSLGESSPWTWAKLANVLHDLGRYSEAVDASKELLAVVKEPADRAHSLGVLAHTLAMHLNQLDAAETTLNEAIRLDPKNIYIYVVFCHIRLRQSRLHDVQKFVIQALRSDSKSSKDWFRLADLCHHNACYVEAEACLRKILDFEPTNAKAWSELAELLWFHLSRKKEAEESLRRAIQLDEKDAGGHARLAMMLRVRGCLDEAEIEARAALQIDSKCPSAWSELGTLEYQKRNFKQSAGALRTAIQFEPKDADLWYELALALEALGETIEAQQALKRSVELDEDEVLAWSKLTEIAIHHGSPWQEFADRTMQALERGRLAADLNSVAWSWLQLPEPELLRRSIQLSQRSVEKSPDSLKYKHTLAVALGKNADWEEAISVARSFIDSAGRDEEALTLTTDFIIRAAASEQVDIAIETLESSPAKDFYEPLLVAMKMLKGESVEAPQEIVEVARDIIKQVELARKQVSPLRLAPEGTIERHGHSKVSP